MSNLEVEHTTELGIIEDKKMPEASKPEKHVQTPREYYLSSFQWNIIFLLSCIIGVLNDPLFLYIPIINENKKCLGIDEKLKNVVLGLRTITDIAFLLHFLVQIVNASKKKNNSSIWKEFNWFDLLVDFLAILPFPQVVVLVFFPKMGSKSLITRRYLNILILAQYPPRLLRIYSTTKELGMSFEKITRSLWIRGAYNFCLYITCGHVFGAFWYFYSIFRITSCWQMACRNLPGCNSDTSLICQSKFAQTKNVTYFNEECHEKFFKFGIFERAIKSDTLTTRSFPKKFFYCFWWGLKNLSSFGSNLETSDHLWENVFATAISILGSLLFLYLIGNLQTYLGLSSQRAEEKRQKIHGKGPEIDSFLLKYDIANRDDRKNYIMELKQKIMKAGKLPDQENILSEVQDRQDKSEAEEWLTKILDEKQHQKNRIEQSIKLWISKNNDPPLLKEKIITDYMLLRLQESNNDVDVVNILSILRHSHKTAIKKHLCMDTLQKVPLPQNMDYDKIIEHLKPVIYQENTYIIRRGEPIDFLLFITQGVVWIFGETNHAECLRKGNYFGNELIEWRLKSKSHLVVPISTINIKSHTKVEAFVLMVADLEDVLSPNVGQVNFDQLHE